MVKRFFNFDIFITTTVVKILYGIVFVLLILAGLAMVAMSLMTFQAGFAMGIKSFLVALLAFLVGVPLYLVMIRIWFECVLVLFKINENLQRMADGGQKPGM